MFQVTRERTVPVVIDEFPCLVKSTPGLPSIIHRELGPGGSGTGSYARLLLCGSAMSVMGDLLSGRAPLRGRAGLELAIQPFSYTDAARFWGIDDPKLAVLVHSVVGGTPAYRREFIRDDVPRDLEDFDSWVGRTVLSPRQPPSGPGAGPISLREGYLPDRRTAAPPGRSSPGCSRRGHPRRRAASFRRTRAQARSRHPASPITAYHMATRCGQTGT